MRPPGAAAAQQPALSPTARPFRPFHQTLLSSPPSHTHTPVILSVAHHIMRAFPRCSERVFLAVLAIFVQLSSVVLFRSDVDVLNRSKSSSTPRRESQKFTFFFVPLLPSKTEMLVLDPRMRMKKVLLFVTLPTHSLIYILSETFSSPPQSKRMLNHHLMNSFVLFYPSFLIMKKKSIFKKATRS